MIKDAENRVLVCRECGEEFVLTSEARKFLEERGVIELPQWCRSCFVQMKRRRRANRHRMNTLAEGKH